MGPACDRELAPHSEAQSQAQPVAARAIAVCPTLALASDACNAPRTDSHRQDPGVRACLGSDGFRCSPGLLFSAAALSLLASDEEIGLSGARLWPGG
jgi:hypothetical protein